VTKHHLLGKHIPFILQTSHASQNNSSDQTVLQGLRSGSNTFSEMLRREVPKDAKSFPQKPYTHSGNWAKA